MRQVIETCLTIKAPAGVVWKILTDTRAWPRWGPSVRAVRCQDRFIQTASTGHVQTIFGLWIPFEITRFIQEKEWSWRVSHINATGHRVKRISKNRCRLIFEVPVFGAPYLIVCAIAARRIKKLAEQDGME